MTAIDIDTRSDIYSLGVLLYELLTGRTPFDSNRLMEAGFDEIRRIIREEDPPRPSTKISVLSRDEQAIVAKRRQLEAPKLASLIRGDLDWIAMKCLEKDRTRRYETASGLASDVQRHLENEPVLARPPRAIYSLGKFVRRYKVISTIMFVSVTALLLSASTFTAYDVVTYRNTMIRHLLVTSEIAAAESTAAVNFLSPEEAQEKLNALRHDPHIVFAALYDSERNVLARYPTNQQVSRVFPSPRMDGIYSEGGFLGGSISIYGPVTEGTNRIGTLFLKADLSGLTERLRLYAGIAVLVFIVSVLVALALSTILIGLDPDRRGHVGVKRR